MKTINKIIFVLILFLSHSIVAQVTPFSDSGNYLVAFDNLEPPTYGDSYTELFIRSRIEASQNDMDLILVVSGQKNRIIHVTVDDSLVRLFLFKEGSYVPTATKEWVSTDHRLEQLKGYYQSHFDSGMHADFYSIGIYQHEQLQFRILIDGVQKCGQNIRGIPALEAFFQEMSVYGP